MRFSRSQHGAVHGAVPFPSWKFLDSFWLFQVSELQMLPCSILQAFLHSQKIRGETVKMFLFSAAEEEQHANNCILVFLFLFFSLWVEFGWGEICAACQGEKMILVPFSQHFWIWRSESNCIIFSPAFEGQGLLGKWHNSVFQWYYNFKMKEQTSSEKFQFTKGYVSLEIKLPQTLSRFPFFLRQKAHLSIAKPSSWRRTKGEMWINQFNVREMFLCSNIQ